MQVTYDSSNAADQWRCGIYSLTGRPTQFLMLLLSPIVLGALFGRNLHLGAAGFIGTALLSVVVTIVILLASMWIQIKARASRGPRMCATMIVPEGVLDMTPDKTTPIVWSAIQEVRCHDGDVHVWASPGGIFVPRSAFQNLQHAQAFCDAITAAKRGDFSGVTMPQPPAAVYHQPQSWPPAPQSSYPTPPADQASRRDNN